MYNLAFTMEHIMKQPNAYKMVDQTTKQAMTLKTPLWIKPHIHKIKNMHHTYNYPILCPYMKYSPYTSRFNLTPLWLVYVYWIIQLPRSMMKCIVVVLLSVTFLWSHHMSIFQLSFVYEGQSKITEPYLITFWFGIVGNKSNYFL